MKERALNLVKKQNNFYSIYPRIVSLELFPSLENIELGKVFSLIEFYFSKKKVAFKLVQPSIPVQKVYGSGKKPYKAPQMKKWI